MAAALPFILAGSTVASTVMGAYGAMAAGNAQKQAYDYNAAVQRNEGQAAMDQAAAKAQAQEQDNERSLGRARAAYGASGVDANSGTPLAVMADVASQGELAKRLKIYQGRLAQIASSDQSNIDTYEGKAAQEAGTINATTDIFTGVSKAAQAFYMPRSGGGS